MAVVLEERTTDLWYHRKRQKTAWYAGKGLWSRGLRGNGYGLQMDGMINREKHMRKQALMALSSVLDTFRS